MPVINRTFQVILVTPKAKSVWLKQRALKGINHISDHHV